MFFKTFLKSKHTKLYSKIIDKSPNIVERIIRTIVYWLKKPVFLAVNSFWLSELPSVFEQKNKTVHHNIETSPTQASNKSNEKEVFSNIQDK